MSLRFRLISLVCAVLVVSLAIGATIAYSTARRSVCTEMRAALMVGHQTIVNAINQPLNLDDTPRILDQLVASFDGNRHLRVWLSGSDPAIAAPTREGSRFGGAPGWFVRLIGVAPQIERIPVSFGGRDYKTIIIETDPNNETLEVWNEFTESLIAPSIFCVLTVLLIYVFIGRILQPLDRLARALVEVGDGCYQIRLNGHMPPELSRLRASFNCMAERLEHSDAENRLLNEQLLTLQEQERADLARDLHDEVSPFLFAINVDAANVSRLLGQHRWAEAHDHMELIVEAVRHAQQQVRRMLGRLRPIEIEELSLPEQIERTVAFWRRRRPDIRYEVTIDVDCDSSPELVGTICRIVQEALSNAIRHANPQLIAISIARNCRTRSDDDAIVLEIADNGRGMDEPNRTGYGLLGIRERVKAMGGRLTLSNRPEAGFVVSVVLPCLSVSDCLSPTQKAES